MSEKPFKQPRPDACSDSEADLSAKTGEGAELFEAESRVLSDRIVEFYERLSAWEHSVVDGADLSLAQIHVVEILGIYGGLRMRDLASRLGVSTGTLTVTIDKLEKNGVVARVANPDDRRSWFIELTESGRKIQEEHSAYHLSLVREATCDFSFDEQKLLSQLLAKFLKNL